MTTEQRLQRLEDEFEVVKDLLVSTARYAESANQGLDRVWATIDRVTESQAASQAAWNEQFRQVSETQTASQAALDAQLGQLGRAQAATEAQMERTDQRLNEFIFQVQRLLSRDAERLDIVEGRIKRLEAIAQRLDRNYEAQQAQFQEFQIATLASQERQERLLEYLLRRDSETR